MKTACAFLTLFISSTMPVAAQQIPETSPKQWSVYVRFYGTTSMPGRDILQIYVHTNGSLPACMSARRPVSDELGKMLSKSPEDKRKLSEATSAAIYLSARSVIHNHRIGEEPDLKVACPVKRSQALLRSNLVSVSWVRAGRISRLASAKPYFAGAIFSSIRSLTRTNHSFCPVMPQKPYFLDALRGWSPTDSSIEPKAKRSIRNEKIKD